MAEATFTLRAVDATKSAFASVQNSLQGLVKSSQLISKAIMTGFGVGSVFGIINVLVGKITDRMEEVKRIEDQIQEIYKRQIEAQKELFFQKQKPTDQLSILEEEKRQIQNNLDLYKETAAWRKITIGPEIGYMLDKSKRQTSVSVVVALSKEQELKVAQLTDESKKLEAKINAINDSLEKTRSIDAETARINRIKTLNDVLKTQEDSFDTMLDAQRKLNAEYKSGKDKETSEKKSMQSIADSYKSAIDPMFDYANALKELKMLSDDGLLTELEYAKAVELVGNKFVAQTEAQKMYVDSLGLTSEEMERVSAAMKQLQMIDDAGMIIAQGFEDAIFSGKKLSEVIKAIGMDLLRMVFQQTVTSSLATGISGAIKGAFGMRAMGGPVSSGSPYIVGERGPELFVPHASGSIVSNSNMTSGGGASGPSINVNYNIAAGVTRSELQPILEQERRRLKAEIPDMVRRGGAYRSAFA